MFATYDVDKIIYSWHHRINQLVNSEWMTVVKITYANRKVEKYFSDYKEIRYSLHVAPHVRLIIEINAAQDMVMLCEKIEVEGVTDYHGSKENWFIC